MKQISKGMAAVAALLALGGCTLFGGDGGGKTVGDTSSPPQQKVGQVEDTTPVLVADTVYFDYDKATLRPEALPVLGKVAEWMQQHRDKKVRIAGHADERGTREYNLALGNRRATAVRSYLISLGVPAQRLETVSYGKERPVAVGSDETAWAKNRRAVAEIE